MKALVVLLILCVAAAAADGTGPEPAPWWMRVEEFQALATKWLTMITLVLTGAVTAIFTVWKLIDKQLDELRSRADRAAEEKRALQTQVTAIAMQVDPTSPKV